MKKKKVMLFLTIILVGLTAGLFYAWSCSVTPGLKPLPDDQYILAFQSLTREIQNPVFFICFIGSALVLPVSAGMYWGEVEQLRSAGDGIGSAGAGIYWGRSIRFWWLLGASVVYIAGVIGITGMGNIPLNDALDAFDVRHATTAQIAQQRALFEAPWNRLNNWRTVACVVAFALTLAACFRWGDPNEM